ncbi:MAG: hypothetical protein M1366_00990 [Patescibacteria group bacterium]|nr:hypothetical protein [Patescibacteria group bacterium]
MKALLVVILLIGIVLIGGYSLGLFKPKEATPRTANTSQDSSLSNEEKDMVSIRSFMAQSNLELTFINSDLPMPYFRVGKVTKMDNGENMEKVDDWVRKVNVYDQKNLINGQCFIYEYHADARNHNLTAVIIRGLRPNEVDTLKKNGTTCVANSSNMPRITKAEAEMIAMYYLKRAIPNLDQIKNQFTYSLQSNGEAHEWLWEDKSYKLPEGLEGRPYSYPTIRMTVNGDKTISYWNTESLFQN